jgi:hypothetical protein
MGLAQKYRPSRTGCGVRPGRNPFDNGSAADRGWVCKCFGFGAWTKAVVPVSQAEMVPFRLAKMKCANAPFPPFPTRKDVVFTLLTEPVGPWGPLGVVGIATKPLGGLMIVLVTLVLSVTA